MKKRMLSTLVALSMVVTLSTTVLAAPSQADLDKQNASLQQSKSQYDAAKQKRVDLESTIQKMDNDINQAMNDIEKIKGQQTDAQNQIVQAQSDLQKAEDDIKTEQQLFDGRMKAMYINGTDSYVDILVNSKSLTDLVQRVQVITSLAEYDKKVTDALNKKKVVINEKKKQLDDKVVQLASLKKQNEDKIASIAKAKSDQVAVVAQYKEVESKTQALFAADQAAVNSMQQQLKAIRDAATKYIPSRGAASLSGNSVLAYASNFLNTKYVYGGTTPDGFDCSGFVQYVYAHFGVGLGRSTYDQINDGVEVSLSQLQPGDLVFFGSYGAPHHVGIYVGGDCYIHSPQTGDVVKVSSLGSRSDICRARRVK